jgi:hypothetical protein
MSRFARLAATFALVAALCCRAYANVHMPLANLDPSRMFDPASESLLAALFVTPKELSPVSVALFNAPAPAAISIAPPVISSAPIGSGTGMTIALHAYAPPAELPSRPVEEPSVLPAAPLQHAQLAASAAHAQTSSTQVHFGTYAPYAPAAQALALNEDVRVPVRIGAVHFSGLVSGTQQQTTRADAVRAMQLCGTTDEGAACPYLHDERAQTLAAGTNFNARVWNTRLNLQLSGSVGHITSADAAMYQYLPLDPDPELDAVRAGSPEDTSMLYYPGLTDMISHGVNANLAVPISPVVTVGLQYDTAHYQGNYGPVFAPGIDARKDTYLGKVTYQLPNSSLLTLSARQYRYQDSLTPFNLTETRADLSFTVKF